jgi:DNA-binding response OmpR family regulator
MATMDESRNDRVLVVDDDPEVCTALATLLRCEGFQVTTAADGQEALERMRDANPRVVLLDLMMPVLDGFEFRVRQLEDAQLASVPVIVLSCGTELPRKIASFGAAGCLSKPLDPDELIAMVRRIASSPTSRC